MNDDSDVVKALREQITSLEGELQDALAEGRISDKRIGVLETELDEAKQKNDDLRAAMERILDEARSSL